MPCELCCQASSLGYIPFLEHDLLCAAICTDSRQLDCRAQPERPRLHNERHCVFGGGSCSSRAPACAELGPSARLDSAYSAWRAVGDRLVFALHVRTAAGVCDSHQCTHSNMHCSGERVHRSGAVCPRIECRCARCARLGGCRPVCPARVRVHDPCDGACCGASTWCSIFRAPGHSDR